MRAGELFARLLLVAGGVLVFVSGLLMATLTALNQPGCSMVPVRDCPVFSIGDWGRILLAGVLAMVGAVPRRVWWVASIVGFSWAFVGYLPDALYVDYGSVPWNAAPALAAEIFPLLQALGTLTVALGLFWLWWELRGRADRDAYLRSEAAILDGQGATGSVAVGPSSAGERAAPADRAPLRPST